MLVIMASVKAKASLAEPKVLEAGNKNPCRPVSGSSTV